MTRTAVQDERLPTARARWAQRIGIYLPSYFILGIAIPALVYVLVMALLGWRIPVFGSSAAVAFSDSQGTVYLFASKSTRDYMSRVGGNYNVVLDPWRAYFAERKRGFREVDDLGSLPNQATGSVLILPSTVALSDSDRSRIHGFRARGGSVLATWVAGARNAAGDWQGWQFLEQLGVQVVGEMTDNEERQLVLNGESPVSHTQPAGQRIWMSKASEPLLRLRGEMVAGRFTNWARVVDSARRAEGAVLYAEGSATAGRSVVFGFAETTWESHPAPMYPLIDDVLQWLRREPAVVRAAWPEGKKAANVIEMDTEEGFPNALRLVEQLRPQGIPATFFLLTSVARQHPEIVTELARDYEIGYHGDVHESYKGQPEAVQERRLETMKGQLQSVLPDIRQVLGFRAPLEGYDDTTQRLLQKVGIRYHAADPNSTEGRLPFVFKMENIKPEDALIVLPRTQRDDINFNKEKLDLEQISQALIDDFDMTADTGALGWLSLHSQNFGADAPLAQALPSYLQHLKQRNMNIWYAQAGQVAAWWRERERFKVGVDQTGRRIDLNITVTRGKPIERANVIVMLPFKNAVSTIRSTKVGITDPITIRLDPFRTMVKFPPLAPGDYSYRVTFDVK
ncbi:MAG: polysaccharide deacetylase family protein [Proteobacteria bacterium]|nr:polysaccharide deacetylase family protein [Pseudomonadota bacterium]